MGLVSCSLKGDTGNKYSGAVTGADILRIGEKDHRNLDTVTREEICTGNTQIGGYEVGFERGET